MVPAALPATRARCATAKVSSWLRAAIAGLAGLLLLAAAAAPAVGAPADSVTLDSSAATVLYGRAVTLSGVIDPAAAGETVSIVSGGGKTLATAETDGSGAFSVRYAPERNVTVHAEWGSATSDSIGIRVRIVIRLGLENVRLFGTAVVRGRVSPPHPRAAVLVKLRRGGRVTDRRKAKMTERGRFVARFPIRQPGTYRAVATFGDAGHLRGTRSTGTRSTPLPVLRKGSRGIYVGLLERRLVELDYYLTRVNQAFDRRTADAVTAFTKVQRMRRRATVDAAVWRALAAPKAPEPRSRTGRFHVEIDQSRQVIYTVHRGTITGIVHTSTGKSSTPTRNGSFRVRRKIAGYSPNRLYYPSYFDGRRAIHGWPEVPTYPASHGCARVPYWTAKWLFRLAKLGTKIVVYR